MIEIENEDCGIHPCYFCKKDSLNKGIVTRWVNKEKKEVAFRLIFCLEHKQHEIPLETNTKHSKKLDHEFLFYKHTNLEKLYIETCKEKYKQYLENL